MSVTLNVIPFGLDITDLGAITISAVVIQMIREQCAASMSSSGAPFPPSSVDGRMLVMRDTGNMLNTLEAHIGFITATEPYAEFVNDKFNWFGLAPQNFPEAYKRMNDLRVGEEIFDENAR